MEYVIVAILLILFGLFLYWAYLPDYKMNPKQFWRILIGMLCSSKSPDFEAYQKSH